MGNTGSKIITRKNNNPSPVENDVCAKPANDPNAGESGNPANSNDVSSNGAVQAVATTDQTENGDAAGKDSLNVEASNSNDSAEANTTGAPDTHPDQETPASSGTTTKKRNPIQWLKKKISFKRAKPVGEDTNGFPTEAAEQVADTTCEASPPGQEGEEVVSEPKSEDKLCCETAPSTTPEVNSQQPELADVNNTADSPSSPVKLEVKSEQSHPTVVENLANGIPKQEVTNNVQTAETHVNGVTHTSQNGVKMNGHSSPDSSRHSLNLGDESQSKGKCVSALVTESVEQQHIATLVE